jgi:hypothetical protein
LSIRGQISIPDVISNSRVAQTRCGHFCCPKKTEILNLEHGGEGAFVSQPTLRRIEAGDPGVSIGLYLAVLSILGLGRGIGDLASIENDPLGLALDEERLPERK